MTNPSVFEFLKNIVAYCFSHVLLITSLAFILINQFDKLLSIYTSPNKFDAENQAINLPNRIGMFGIVLKVITIQKKATII